MYAPGSDVVQHVGLLQRAVVFSGEEFPVYDQQPPPRLAPDATATMPTDLVGYIELDESEVEGFQVEIGRLRTMFEGQRLRPAKTYTARPAIEVQSADGGATVLYYRFSCVGFVQHCYRRVLGRALVDDVLPSVTLAEVVPVWVAATDPSLRAMMGLPPPEPWDVLLPSHAFHAIEQAGARPYALPFRATAQHARFPKPAATAADPAAPAAPAAAVPPSEPESPTPPPSGARR